MTTGSKATDIRSGSERLPGRKGRLARTEFRAASIKGITIHQCLPADGLPHPDAGQVADPDLYNEYGRFEGTS